MMKRIRSYSKSEDAYLAASILGSSGIDAVVIDDNALGGNLLATLQKNAIRLEVEEAQFEEAEAILAQAERIESPAEEEETTAPPVVRGRSRLFDFLVACELASLLLFAMIPGAFYPEPGPEMEEEMVSLVVSEDLLGVAYDLQSGHLVLSGLASVLLLLRLNLGRILFLGTTGYGVISFLFLPALFASPLGASFLGFSWMLTGAVLAMSWLPPVAGEFRKRIRA